ncbi:MAG TPA: glycosyltransferase family 4 protein [Acidobacteriota bacterium]|nr:glycosyltransferase family 4 protein [Acidobacteriota bacterium]
MADKRLKIAFISEPWDTVDPPPANWSGPILTYEIAKRLAQSCDVVVYSRKLSHLPKVKRYQSVEFRYIPLFADRRGGYRLTHLPVLNSLIDEFKKNAYPNIHRPSYAADLAFWTYIVSIALDLRSQNCDVVHIHQFSQFAPIVRMLNPQAKIVLHMHTDWMNQFDREFIKGRLKKCDLILGCSEFIANNIRKRFSDLASRCDFLHNGVDVEHFSGGNGPKNKRILFVGRVSPEKGVHVLLDAFQIVLKTHPDSELLLAGPWRSASKRFIDFADDPLVSGLAQYYEMDYLAFLKSKFKDDLADRVQFLGPVEHRGLVDLYRNSNILAFPSVWNEPFGMPVVEAMSSNCSVVATRAGGIVEIVEDGKSGLLAERNNVEALANAILQILDNPDFRLDLVQAGRQRAVEYFSWEKIVNDLLQKYSSILKN